MVTTWTILLERASLTASGARGEVQTWGWSLSEEPLATSVEEQKPQVYEDFWVHYTRGGAVFCSLGKWR